MLSLAGCSVQNTVSGWFRKAPHEARAEAGQVYYAGVEGLIVHGEPSSSARVVGHLSLHEKVTRYKIERGYAYVKSDTSGLKGWVNNAMLIWRLPARAKPAPDLPAEPAAEEPSEVPEPPATPESEEPASAPPDTPAADASPTPSVVSPSLFDAY
jgi:hypothetical protein